MEQVLEQVPERFRSSSGGSERFVPARFRSRERGSGEVPERFRSKVESFWAGSGARFWRRSGSKPGEGLEAVSEFWTRLRERVGEVLEKVVGGCEAERFREVPERFRIGEGPERLRSGFGTRFRRGFRRGSGSGE